MADEQFAGTSHVNNGKSTWDKDVTTPVSHPIERRRSKPISSNGKVEKSSSWISWLFCFNSTKKKNKVKIKEKYESVLYLPNQEENIEQRSDRKPEFNKSLSSENIKNSHSSGNHKNGQKRKTSIANDNNGRDSNMSKVEKPNSIITGNSPIKQSLAKEFMRRHSWNILVSKLESNKNILNTPENNQVALDNVSAKTKSKRHHRKRPHKGSWDSSSLSSHSNQGGPISNQLLKLKAEEVKAGGVTPPQPKNMATSNLNMNSSNSNNVRSVQSRNMMTHKDSKDSGAITQTEGLGESIAPPMMIDSSAVMFSNPK